MSSAGVIWACVASPVSAQDAHPPQLPLHDQPSNEIVVTGALPTSRLDALSGVSVLSAEDLQQAVRPSIGDTLVHTPGASATSFGPSASRPVLRGLQGERVRVLADGIGSIDASNTSADHAPAINPLLAERIEVLRGPQSLQFGSSAIGGVVNVITTRIPTEIPEMPFHLAGMAGYAYNADERSASGAIDVPLGLGFVAHADGSYLKAGDQRIPGYALTTALRQEGMVTAASNSGDPAIDYMANADVSGRLPNTEAKTWNAAGALGWIGDKLSMGAAYSRLDSLYGVPIRFATRPGQEQETPRIHLQQDRWDARAAYDAHGAFVDKINLRAGYADYRHFELEEDGAIGTGFFSKGLEGRAELVQAKRGGWAGASGLQFVARSLRIEGDEAFLPRNRTRQVGLFSVQSLDRGPLRLEAGARWERSVQTAVADAASPQFFSGERSFDAFSGSLGGAYAVASGWKLGVNVSRTERAPAAEELFAKGPHAGTAAFEIGDPSLGKERAWSLEGIVKGRAGPLKLNLSAYHTWFSGFIYQHLTGAVEDGLPVYQISQADARHYGFEAEGSAELATFGQWTLEGEALADYVHASIAGNGPAPEIPPLRVLGGLNLRSDRYELRGEVERVTAQHRIAANETATPGYTMVNLGATWRPWGRDKNVSLALDANNVFNVEARRHASVLKDYAPLAGRDLRLSLRFDL